MSATGRDLAPDWEQTIRGESTTAEPSNGGSLRAAGPRVRPTTPAAAAASFLTDIDGRAPNPLSEEDGASGWGWREWLLGGGGLLAAIAAIVVLFVTFTASSESEISVAQDAVEECRAAGEECLAGVVPTSVSEAVATPAPDDATLAEPARSAPVALVLTPPEHPECLAGVPETTTANLGVVEAMSGDGETIPPVAPPSGVFVIEEGSDRVFLFVGGRALPLPPTDTAEARDRAVADLMARQPASRGANYPPLLDPGTSAPYVVPRGSVEPFAGETARDGVLFRIGADETVLQVDAGSVVPAVGTCLDAWVWHAPAI